MESRRTFLKKSALVATMAALPTVSSCIRISTIKAKVPIKSKEIKKAAVLWYSQTGNTQKCGEVLAGTFEKKGIIVISGDIRGFDQIGISRVDLVVIGSPVFYYDIPDYVKDYIHSLPDIKGIPVAAYVTFGGPEGNQQNAAYSILEGMVQRGGVPVCLEVFMTSKSYPPSFKAYEKNLKTRKSTLLPDHNTYAKVRKYAAFIKSEVEKGKSSAFKKVLTLREFSTYFNPVWWTKRSVDNHYIIKQKCVGCGTCVEKCPTDSIDLDTFSVNTDTCVLCFGCINNCQYQAMNIEYNGEKLIGFHEFMQKNNLKFELPVELKT